MNHFCKPVSVIFDEVQAKKIIKAAKTPVVIKFFAPWCDHCAESEIPFQKASCNYSDKAEFIALNIDTMEDLADAFKITALPTVIVVKNGQVIKRHVGSGAEEDFTKFLARALKD